MKSVLSMFLMLFSLQGFATTPTENSEERYEEQKKNSQERLEGNNNKSVIIQSPRKTSSDGVGSASGDTRPQGEEVNADESDTNVEEEE